MKNLIVLGASGSIGSQVLNIVRKFPYKFRLVGVSVYDETSTLNNIIKEFNSLKFVSVVKDIDKQDVYFDNVLIGKDSIKTMLENLPNSLVVNAISGIAGLKPLLDAIELDLDVALANKESVVCAGDFIKEVLSKHPNVSIYPIDSEHSAIYQCLKGEEINNVDKIYITCSGGPFRELEISKFDDIKASDALKHPTWNMGKKISIDSATLFNKGLEIIEAHYLFGFEYEQIVPIIHKESIIHSMVQFKDGNIKALLGPTSMELPIMYAIDDKQRDDYISNYLDFNKIRQFSFEPIDNVRFPSIELAYYVGKTGGNAPLIYCVANEIAVNAFLNEEIKFNDIYNVVNQMIRIVGLEYNYSIERMYQIIENVSRKTRELIDHMKGEK